MIQVRVPADGVTLRGVLDLPSSAQALVMLPRASTGEDHALLTEMLRMRLHARGHGTLSVELLTTAEAAADRNTGWYHLDIPFLSDRLCTVLQWIRRTPSLAALPLSAVATGTVLAGVLVTAARHPGEFSSIVSLHGRADLAGAALPLIQAPTLLVADDREPHLADLNRQAALSLHAIHDLEIVTRPADFAPVPAERDEAAAQALAWIQKYGRTPCLVSAF